jgi:hypothetical protein
MIFMTNHYQSPTARIKIFTSVPIAFFAFNALPASSAPVQTTTTIQITSADKEGSIAVPAKITATADVSNQLQDGDLVGGKLLLSMAVDNYGAPVSCDSSSHYGDTVVAQLDPVNADQHIGTYHVNWNADGSSPGSFGYSASYQPTSPEFSPSQSACVNLVVEDEPCPPSGMSLIVGKFEGSNPGYAGESYNGRYDVIVKNCSSEPVSGVTIESKNNDWARITGFSQEPGTSAVVEQPGSWDQTIRWTIGEIPEGSAMKLMVVVQGSIHGETPVGTIMPLGSKWSAKNADGNTIEADNLASVTVESKPK